LVNAVLGDAISATGWTPDWLKFSADRFGFILRSNITFGLLGESSGYFYSRVDLIVGLIVIS